MRYNNWPENKLLFPEQFQKLSEHDALIKDTKISESIYFIEDNRKEQWNNRKMAAGQ